MILELQISRDRLLPVLRERFKQARACVTDDIESDGVTYVVDRIEISDSQQIARAATVRDPMTGADRPATAMIAHLDGSTDSVPASVARLSQLVTVHLARLADVVAAGQERPGEAPPTAASLGLVVEVDLLLTVSGSGVQLCPRLHRIRPHPLIDEARRRTLEDRVRNAVNVCTALDLGGIAAGLGAPAEVLNAGVALDETGQTVALRIELRDPDAGPFNQPPLYSRDRSRTNRTLDWTAFYRDPESHLGGLDWAFLVDQQILVRRAVAIVGAALAGNDRFTVAPGGDPRARWLVRDGQGLLRVSFNGWAKRVCRCFGVTIDVATWADLDFSFSVAPGPGADTLRVGVHLGYALGAAEVACCVVSGAVLWPIVGALYLAGGEVDIGAFLGGLAAWVFLPAVLWIAAIAQVGGSAGRVQLDVADCERVSDTDWRCDQRLALDIPELGRLRLTSTRGIGAGLVLGGSMSGALNRSPGRLQVVDVPAALDWRNVSGCNRPVDIRASTEIHATNAGDAPLFVCEAEVLDDPAGAYPSTAIRYPTGPIQRRQAVRVDLRFPENGGSAGPYPLHLLLRSSGGVRYFEIGQMAALDDEARSAMLAAWRLHCSYADRFYERREQRIRLPPDPRLVRSGVAASLWRVQAMGIGPGDRVRLESASGQVLADGEADPLGVVALTAIVAAGQDSDGTFLARSGRAHAQSRSEPAILGTLADLVLRAELPLDDKPRALHVGPHDEGAALFVAGEREERVYALDPASPVRLVQHVTRSERAASKRADRPAGNLHFGDTFVEFDAKQTAVRVYSVAVVEPF